MSSFCTAQLVVAKSYSDIFPTTALNTLNAHASVLLSGGMMGAKHGGYHVLYVWQFGLLWCHKPPLGGIVNQDVMGLLYHMKNT